MLVLRHDEVYLEAADMDYTGICVYTICGNKSFEVNSETFTHQIYGKSFV